MIKPGTFVGLAAFLLATSTAAAAPLAANLVPSPLASAELRLSEWPDTGWSVQQYGRLVEIRFPGAEYDIETSSVDFSVLEGVVAEIDVEVRDGDTFLRLTLGCACAVVLSGSPADGVDISVLSSFAAVGADAAGPAPLAAPVPVAKGQNALTQAGAPASGVDPQEVQDKLIAQLMRAAAAGVVELDPGVELDPSLLEAPPSAQSTQPAAANPGVLEAPVPSASSDPNTPSMDANIPPAGVPTSPVAPTATEESAPTVQNAAIGTPEVVTQTEQAQPRCFPTEAFAFPEIVGDGTFTSLLAERRRRMLGEFDQPDPDAAVDLARLYIAALAPEEARAVLAQAGDDHPWAPLYDEIARVMLGIELPAEASLKSAECDGDQALWKAFLLARQGEAAAALASEPVSGRALSKLPLHLRQEVAAELGHAAADESDWTATRRFEALADRAAIGAQARSAKTLLLSSRLAQWHGEEDRALSLLKAARDVRSGGDFEALIALADHALASPDYLAADTSGIRKDLAALATQMRGAPIGHAAFEREARLLTRAASETDIIDFVNAGVAAGLYPAERQASLLSSLVSGSAMAGLSRPLGLIYMDDPSRFANALAEAPFRRAVIRSLAELGVPALAEEIVRPGDLEVQEVAVPLAEALLSNANARSALEVALAMPEGVERERLRAAALAMTGAAASETGGIDAVATGGIAALEKTLSVALAAGDSAAALDASMSLLQMEPDVARAERVVLLAIQAGQPVIPEAAANVLAQRAPDRLAQLETLFQTVPEGLDGEDPAKVDSYLKALDAEMQLIEGYLEDG